MTTTSHILNDTSFPLRITAEEWGHNFYNYDESNGRQYHYDLFTLTVYLEWTGDIESGGWDYQDVYQVTLRRGSSRGATFGPHKTPGLARKKALAYLVKNGAIEIISKGLMQ